MRKYIIGGLVGFCLSFAVGAHAEVVNMIGKTIDGAFPIKLDGKPLENQAIVVDGTSYLPVRVIGEATGYDVKFDADLGISLTKTVTNNTYGGSTMPPDTQTTPQKTPTTQDAQPKLTMEQIEQRINQLTVQLIGVNNGIESSKRDRQLNPNLPQDTRIPAWQDAKKKFEAEIAELEKQKAELTK